jgi:hypothetical protein
VARNVNADSYRGTSEKPDHVSSTGIPRNRKYPIAFLPVA